MNYRFSETIDSFKSSAVREILKLTQGRSIISLAGGLPNEQYFPLDAVRDAFARVFEQGNSVLQYGLTEGFTPLRESISKHLARKGIHAGIDNMLLTTGSQQAIDLLTKIYVDPGDVILVEKPTYLAAIQVFQSHKARLVSVDCDTDGMNPEDLERKIKLHQPKFVYVIPTFATRQEKPGASNAGSIRWTSVSATTCSFWRTIHTESCVSAKASPCFHLLAGRRGGRQSGHLHEHLLQNRRPCAAYRLGRRR